MRVLQDRVGHFAQLRVGGGTTSWKNTCQNTNVYLRGLPLITESATLLIESPRVREQDRVRKTESNYMLSFECFVYLIGRKIADGRIHWGNCIVIPEYWFTPQGA